MSKARPGALQALKEGMSLAIATAPATLPITIAFGLVSTAGTFGALSLADWVVAQSTETLTSAFELGLGVSLFLAAYTGVQFLRRKTVSRASWSVSLLLLPAILLTLLFHLGRNPLGFGPAIPAIAMQTWLLIWGSLGGAGLVIAWLVAAKRAYDGESVSMGTVITEMGSRWLDVAGPHGAKVQAVLVGMQVVIPGVWAALALAYTDMVAVFEPDQPALKRSGRLTYGSRGPIFRILLIWFAASYGVHTAVHIVLEGSTPIESTLIFLGLDPTPPKIGTLIVIDQLAGLLGWVSELAILSLFFGRIQRESARKAARAAERAEAEAPDGNPYQAPPG